MDFSELNRLSSGFVQSRIIQIAVKLGLFDTIQIEGSSSEEISEALGTNPNATKLFLNALVALKVLDKKHEEFYNTQSSLTYLVKESPKYFGDMILFEEGLWDMWGRLEESLRTGKPARPTDMFQEKEQETERFIMAMHSLVEARGDAEILSDMLDLSRVKTVIDIGSGPGTYPIQFLKKYPHLKVTIFDLPGTLNVTKRVLQKEDMLGKIEMVEGDYNTDDLPEGYDLAFLSNIIHSEGIENNQKLMKKVYKSLNPGGKIIIKDHILDDTLTSPPVGAVFSIQMLLATGGRDYSFKEAAVWLEGAGFKKPEWIRLEPPLNSSLLICHK